VAVSHQHLRESQALHFDYYSKKKKTASALRKRIHHGAKRPIASGAHRCSRKLGRLLDEADAPHSACRRAIAEMAAEWALLACPKRAVWSREEVIDNAVGTAATRWNRGS
jgi:hypothetical protein